MNLNRAAEFGTVKGVSIACVLCRSCSLRGGGLGYGGVERCFCTDGGSSLTVVLGDCLKLPVPEVKVMEVDDCCVDSG